jgi:MFS family permease
MADADSDDVPVRDPEHPAAHFREVAVPPRPVWIDALFGVTVMVAFGLSLMRTPVTAGVAAVVFLLGSVVYAILRIRWGRRHRPPRPMQPRTSDGLLYLGLFVVAFLLSGMDVRDLAWRIAYAVVAGLLIGGTAFFLLRREEARRVKAATGNERIRP